ncbi:MAG: GNAT family N-acetyltransferase [Deltaproteobacteria bacterium]|nr:GNAT family N-acetyltransferase [Deltaproteobacteria bacterium]
MSLIFKELTPELWPDLEQLFGERGATGGCWCMYWRHPKGEKWDAVKGAENKRRFRALVESGQAHGALAYAEGEPVGWVSFDKRTDFNKLDRSPSFACKDADQVWSIPCFFIQTAHRRKGIGSRLLEFAVAAIARRGGALAEGYPVNAPRAGKAIPAAFAWTGTRPLFEAAGFTPVGKRDGGKQRMRRSL